MKKMNMLAVAGLVLFSANGLFSMGKQEREILYTLHELGQNIAEVPMITQNIDMFMGVLQMNKQVTEVKLAAANQKVRMALLKNAALVGGILVAQLAASLVLHNVIRSGYVVPYEDNLDLLYQIRLIVGDGVMVNNLLGLALIGRVFAALNLHDVWKNRAELIEALALDQEILVQLQEIKDFMDQDGETAGNFLLKSVE